MPHSNLSSEDRDKFTFLLDCYGAYTHHWPEENRDWALNLIEQYPEVKIVREQALELDQLLDQSSAEPDSAHLMNSILSQAPQKKSQEEKTRQKELRQGLLSQLWPYEGVWRPLSALTTAGIFGILLGTTSPDLLYQQEITEVESAYLEFSLGDSFSNSFPEGEID
ncbi:hypothetical protein WH96_14855 [Kiloniella spongiae]|uniref:Uncharacterized protein n=1 Tax=Kiloniella spongiae TaxID=1489064 RepID=A0A0H2MBT1_9PROT|nr:hypothetical protein [Kiloniella spongiae]KLN59984.1 hypothetical protein WH96_14855 [Kiloniella spongiae]